MRRTVVLIALLFGCHGGKKATPTHASASGTPRTDSSALLETPPKTCEEIEAQWETQIVRFAGQPQTCRRDEDCVCYGGPVCPNALVDVCPAPVRREVADALEPVTRAWFEQGCPVLWSPHGCEPRCVNRRCVSAGP